ncbi:MAG: biotin/lipoate A/B protein ligase family protein [Halodesulfurarchaeum sp.]
MTVRLIDEGEFDEPMHHALDQVMLDRLKAGELEPTVRFWYRTGSAVPLGRFQSYRDEVAVDYVESEDIDVVRRITGGGAMFAEPGDVITYSMYLPTSMVPEGIEESYETLNQWVIDGLSAAGLDAQHEPLNDISHPEGKIGGSAQLRSGDAVLHHTTMSYRVDMEGMLKALRIGKEKVSDKAVKSAEKRVARITDHVEGSRRDVIESLIDGLESAYSTRKSSYETATLEEARELADSKFRTTAWNERL